MKLASVHYIVCLFILSFCSGCGSTDGPPVEKTDLQDEAIATPYTIRLPANDPETQAILLTQVVYAATREDNAAGAIILVPQDPAIAFTAMHRITHMPVNAPLLYLDENNSISAATLEEMRRLKPDGVLQDERTQVYTVNVPQNEVERIEKELKYKVRVFNEPDPVALAELLDRWQATMKSDHPDEIVISAIDHPEGIKHGMGEMGWNAHMGKGFAWVYQDSIPAASRKIFERRYGDHGCYFYLTGGQDVISDQVAVELSQYGLVHRIFGKDVYGSSAVNAGYKDYGRNFAWGWNWTPRAFGWGISQAGHNFVICNADDVLGTIPAAVLGHMGKHGPMLLVQQNQVPPSVAEYLKMVRPFPAGPQETILNFAWIIGDQSRISLDVQMQINDLLSPFPASAVPDTLPADTVPVDTFRNGLQISEAENE